MIRNGSSKKPILENGKPFGQQVADDLISSNNNNINKRKKPEDSASDREDYGVFDMRSCSWKRIEDAIDSSNEEEDPEIGVVDSSDSDTGVELRVLDYHNQGFSKPKKIVHFNVDGQPIGEGTTPFVSYLGTVTRKHCPISYEHWKDVPDQTKEMIWKLVTNEYIVSVAYKTQILQRINKHWREFKSKLRFKHYDKYETDEERKANCPRGIRHEDWDIFVDNQSTPNAQARRCKGKSAREALKIPHPYGRRGASRTEKGVSRYHQQQSESPKVSGPTSSLCLEHVSFEDFGSSKQKKLVYFNDDGQPIGEGSVSFTSNLGSITRRYCPISYEQWWDVPDQIKEMIWKLVTDKYLIAARFKEHILKRVSKHWREFKCQIRSKHYDRYNTNEERKRNCPQGVRQKDWNIFVDNQSTPNAQARRRRGKCAREAMKTPHTSGRRGAARTAEDVVKNRSVLGYQFQQRRFLPYTGAKQCGGKNKSPHCGTPLHHLLRCLQEYAALKGIGVYGSLVIGIAAANSDVLSSAFTMEGQTLTDTELR